MYDADDVLEGARTIRSYLPELLGADAEMMDHSLAELLAKAEAGEKVDNVILSRLARYEATRQWIRTYLEGDQQGRMVILKIFENLPGDAAAMRAREYACPQGDYVWYRRVAGQPVPLCPTHGVPVEPVSPGP